MIRRNNRGLRPPVANCCAEPLEPRRLMAVSLGGATNVGTLAGRSTFSDSLSSANLADLRKFTLSASGTLQVWVNGFTSNTDVQLIRDANSNGVVDSGEILAAGANTGASTAEFLSKSL